MSLKKIRLLKAKKGEAYRKFNEISEELSKLENLQKIPKLIKEYKGKYFKYHNSYGGNEKWWLYVYCSGVSEDARFICSTFQVTPMGLIEIETHSEKGEWLFQIPIKKAEYNKALLKVKELINAL